MNGSVYISFFQGQLEPVLEQVAQLAVQEISRTVGASLNSMLLETVVKERENKQLKLQLQSRENGGGEGGGGGGGGSPPDDAPAAAAEEHPHAPGPRCAPRGMPADTRRLEQKGRVVGKSVPAAGLLQPGDLMHALHCIALHCTPPTPTTPPHPLSWYSALLCGYTTRPIT